MRNYTTFLELDTECQRAAQINADQIQSAVRQRIINHAIYQTYGLLDGANHPWWRRIISLASSTDLEFLADSTVNSGLLTALDASAHTITRSNGAFAAGQLLDIVLVLRSTGARVAQYKALVVSGTSTCIYSVIGSVTGTETTYASATHCLYVTGLKKFSATSYDLSSWYIKDIIRVFDNAGTGGKERSFRQIMDSKIFGSVWDDPFHVNEVAVYHGGDTLYFDVGSSASALSLVQAEVTIKPGIYTDATKNTPVDYPPDENGTVKDLVVAEYLRETGGTPSDSLQKSLALIQKRTEQAQADRMKTMELRGKSE
jgi:hypothetical protein